MVRAENAFVKMRDLMKTKLRQHLRGNLAFAIYPGFKTKGAGGQRQRPNTREFSQPGYCVGITYG